MLNARGSIDPRFALHNRPVATSAMIAEVRVLHPGSPVTPWNPFSDDPDERVFASAVGTKQYTPHYVGRGRVQPNKDWRARRYQWNIEAAADHAVRFQIDLTGNTITNAAKLYPEQKSFEAGGMHNGDVVVVSRVAAPYGIPLEPMIAQFQYVVRNISASSNSWVRTLLCDFVVNDQGGAPDAGQS